MVGSMTWTLAWPDGSVLTARSAAAALAALGDEQMRPCGIEEMRERLSNRCFVWTDRYVDSDLDDDEFLAALGEAGLFRLTIEP